MAPKVKELQARVAAGDLEGARAAYVLALEVHHAARLVALDLGAAARVRRRVGGGRADVLALLLVEVDAQLLRDAGDAPGEVVGRLLDFVPLAEADLAEGRVGRAVLDVA